MQVELLLLKSNYKKIFSLFSAIILLNNLNAQVQFNADARMFQMELKTELAKGTISPSFVSQYDLIKIDGVYHIGALGVFDNSSDPSESLRQFSIKSDSRIGAIRSLRIPLSNFNMLENIAGLKYLEISNHKGPLLEHALLSARVDSVQAGLGQLMQAYKGSGVIVAVIDWGFDYTHPNFYDSTFTQLRISRAWDQNKTTGPPPTGYSFGTEYVGMEQLLQAQEDTLYVFGPGSHGTHVAGIAGGNGSNTAHIGAAPEAELIFISLLRDAPSLIDAFTYISDYADSVGKPFVVNMSFGAHMGPHDGTMLENQAIDAIQGTGKVFVGSAGNNGTSSARFHLDHQFLVGQTDTIKTVVAPVNIADSFGNAIAMWGSANTSFSAAVRMVSPQNETLFETPFYFSSASPLAKDTFLFGANQDTLILRVYAEAQSPLNDKPYMRFEAKRTGNAKLVLLLTSEDSCRLHLWSVVRMKNRFTNWGIAFDANYPGAIAGDFDYGVGEPGGSGITTITVGSYRAERTLSNGNTIYGALSNFSSFGPTVDERIKPDISSTGEVVMSSVNSFDPSTSPTNTLVFQGRTYGFRAFSGTSMSGPMVAGIVALMLQANPQLTALQVREILRQTARLDQHTGEIGQEGHLRWGWGKANALAAVKAAELLTHINTPSSLDFQMSIYPNPAHDLVTVQLGAHPQKAFMAEIVDLQGRTVFRQQHAANQIQLPVSDLSEGVYLVLVYNAEGYSAAKLIISR